VQVTRTEFEDAASDLFARATLPIDEALKMAGMTVSDIHAVEILGGGVRMPKVMHPLSTLLACPVLSSYPLRSSKHLRRTSRLETLKSDNI
jgi:hypoxia up-regulated 1